MSNQPRVTQKDLISFLRSLADVSDPTDSILLDCIEGGFDLAAGDFRDPTRLRILISAGVAAINMRLGIPTPTTASNGDVAPKVERLLYPGNLTREEAVEYTGPDIVERVDREGGTLWVWARSPESRMVYTPPPVDARAIAMQLALQLHDVGAGLANPDAGQSDLGMKMVYQAHEAAQALGFADIEALRRAYTRETFDEMVHPNGRCTCACEGTCAWCLDNAARERAEAAHAASRARGFVDTVDEAESTLGNFDGPLEAPPRGRK